MYIISRLTLWFCAELCSSICPKTCWAVPENVAWSDGFVLSRRKSTYRWIVGWLSLEGTLGDCLVQSVAESKFPGLCRSQRLNKLLGKPMPSHLHDKKKCFLKCSVLYFSLGPLAPVLSWGTAEKALPPSSLHPLISFPFLGVVGIDTRKMKCFLLWHITKTAEVLCKEF